MALFETYTGRIVGWDDAVEEVNAGRGHVHVLVVREVGKGGKEPVLTYGFFLRSNDGTVYDVQMAKRHGLKTLQFAHGVMEHMQQMYGNDYGHTIPYLREDNLVGRGEVETAIEKALAAKITKKA